MRLRNSSPGWSIWDDYDSHNANDDSWGPHYAQAHRVRIRATRGHSTRRDHLGGRDLVVVASPPPRPKRHYRVHGHTQRGCDGGGRPGVPLLARGSRNGSKLRRRTQHGHDPGVQIHGTDHDAPTASGRQRAADLQARRQRSHPHASQDALLDHDALGTRSMPLPLLLRYKPSFPILGNHQQQKGSST